MWVFFSVCYVLYNVRYSITLQWLLLYDVSNAKMSSAVTAAGTRAQRDTYIHTRCPMFASAVVFIRVHAVFFASDCDARSRWVRYRRWPQCMR